MLSLTPFAPVERRSRSRRGIPSELRYENPSPQFYSDEWRLGFQPTMQAGRRPPRPNVLPLRPKRPAYARSLPDVILAPPPPKAGPRGPPPKQRLPDPELYRQADRDIEEHGWQQFLPYEFTAGSFLAQHLTTFSANNLVIKDFNSFPADFPPNHPQVMRELQQLAFQEPRPARASNRRD